MVIEAQDRCGKQALRLMFDADGMLRVKTGGAAQRVAGVSGGYVD